MVLAIFVLIAWIIISVYLLVPKKLTLVENIFIFFSATILIINIATIVDLNLGLVQSSKVPEKFLAMWLQRNIIDPIFIVIFINFIFYNIRVIKKMGIMLIVILVLNLVEFVAIQLGVKTYKGWNTLFANISLATVLFISFLLIKWFQKLRWNVVNKS